MHTCHAMGYKIMYKKIMGQTLFWLVYGMEVVMLMEYIIPSLRIAMLTGMVDQEALEERLTQLEELEEERLRDHGPCDSLLLL